MAEGRAETNVNSSTCYAQLFISNVISLSPKFAEDSQCFTEEEMYGEKREKQRLRFARKFPRVVRVIERTSRMLIQGMCANV